MPNLSTTYEGNQPDTTQENLVPYDENYGIDLILDKTNIVEPLEELIALLQKTNSKGVPSVSYDISMNISQYNSCLLYTSRTASFHHFTILAHHRVIAAVAALVDGHVGGLDGDGLGLDDRCV